MDSVARIRTPALSLLLEEGAGTTVEVEDVIDDVAVLSLLLAGGNAVTTSPLESIKIEVATAGAALRAAPLDIPVVDSSCIERPKSSICDSAAPMKCPATAADPPVLDDRCQMKFIAGPPAPVVEGTIGSKLMFATSTPAPVVDGRFGGKLKFAAGSPVVDGRLGGKLKIAVGIPAPVVEGPLGTELTFTVCPLAPVVDC